MFNELFELTKTYFSKAENPDDKNHYVLHFFSSLKLAFSLAEQSKLKEELKTIIDYIYSIHQEWNIEVNGTLRVLLDLSGLMSKHYKHFKDLVDFNKIIEKNNAGAKKLEKSYVWGAIYVVDINIKISEKIKSNYDYLIRHKAQLYEKLSADAEKNGNMACITFSEDALRLYQQLNDKEKIIELETQYSEQRGKFELGKIKQELPKEYTKQIQENITRTIAENNETQILIHFITTPWYDKIENIEKRAEEGKEHSVLMSMLGTSILDKFGNTIDKFQTDEERDKYNFWQTYSFNFQLGTQTMHHFFIDAYKAKKIHYSSVISYLFRLST